MHPQVDTRAIRNVFARGIAASPGGAVGRIVFTSAEAQACAARREPCILVRRETAPEDVRGMHAAAAVLMAPRCLAFSQPTRRSFSPSRLKRSWPSAARSPHFESTGPRPPGSPRQSAGPEVSTQVLPSWGCTAVT